MGPCVSISKAQTQEPFDMFSNQYLGSRKPSAVAYREIGATFVLVGVDTLLLRNAAVALAARFKGGAARAGAAY